MVQQGTMTLKRAGTNVKVAEESPKKKVVRPSQQRAVSVIGMGNSGESVAHRVQALSWADGYDIQTAYINNDLHGPSPLAVRLPSGEVGEPSVTNRLVMMTANRRDEIKQFPLLVKRYEKLLRGIPVFETYNQGGRGGHSIPQISAMDYDLHVEPLLNLLRKLLAPRLRQDKSLPHATGVQRLLRKRVMQKKAANEAQIVVVIGGGSGSAGNAGHHLMPYLIRHLLSEMGMNNYELWGVILGPMVFKGLTADTWRNYYGLMRSLEHMTMNGQKREYINGLCIDRAVPPYDRTFLLDDPLAQREEGRVTEDGLNTFFNRAALSLHLLLGTNAYDVVASHVANPQEGIVAAQEHRMRWLSTVSGQMITVDRQEVQKLLALKVKQKLLADVVTRLSAQ